MTTAGQPTASRRRSLTDKAYDHVRTSILRGDLSVGTVIAEAKLADELGISKTPMRQALQLLRTEGLLEVGPRRQLVVRGFSPGHRNEVLRIREALEEIAVETACRVITVEQIDQLQLSLLRQKRAVHAHDEEDFLLLDEEFHIQIASFGEPADRGAAARADAGVRAAHAARALAAARAPAGHPRGAHADRRGARAARCQRCVAGTQRPPPPLGSPLSPTELEVDQRSDRPHEDRARRGLRLRPELRPRPLCDVGRPGDRDAAEHGRARHDRRVASTGFGEVCPLGPAYLPAHGARRAGSARTSSRPPCSGSRRATRARSTPPWTGR